MFGFKKIERKCKREKIDGKSRRKEKKLKLINYFYLLLQTYLTYFNSSI